MFTRALKPQTGPSKNSSRLYLFSSIFGHLWLTQKLSKLCTRFQHFLSRDHENTDEKLNKTNAEPHLRLVIAMDYAHQLAPGGHVGFLKADIELRHKDDHSNHGSFYTFKGVRQKCL